MRERTLNRELDDYHFLKLNDLNANGIILEDGERPEDEFNVNSWRWAWTFARNEFFSASSWIPSALILTWEMACRSKTAAL